MIFVMCSKCLEFVAPWEYNDHLEFDHHGQMIPMQAWPDGELVLMMENEEQLYE